MMPFAFALFLFIGYLASMADNLPSQIAGWIVAAWIFISALINKFFNNDRDY